MAGLLDPDFVIGRDGLPQRIQQPTDGLLASGAPTWADAWQFNTQAAGDWIDRQRAISAERGLWDDATGLPTPAGVVDAAGQTAQGIMMGSTAPGAPKLSLVRIGGRERAGPDMVESTGSYVLKDPDGNQVGDLYARWNPVTRNLHIEDIQSPEGAGSLGPAAIRQLRSGLLELYPEARTISGHRVAPGEPIRDAIQNVGGADATDIEAARQNLERLRAKLPPWFRR